MLLHIAADCCAHISRAQILASTHCSAETHPDEPVLGLELLCRIQVVVDQTEAGRLATTELQKRTLAGLRSDRRLTMQSSSGVRRGTQ